MRIGVLPDYVAHTPHNAGGAKEAISRSAEMLAEQFNPTPIAP